MGGLLILFALLVPTLLWANLEQRLRLARVAVTSSPSARSVSPTTSSRCGVGATSASRRAPSSCCRCWSAALAGATLLWALPRSLRLRADAQLSLLQGPGGEPGPALRPVRRLRPGRRLERGQPDRRPRRPGDRRHAGGRGHLRGLHLRRRQLAASPATSRSPTCRASARWRSSAARWSARRSASSGATRTRREVFMGDVGSLALGGAIGSVAVLAKQELLLVAGRRPVRARGAVGDHPGRLVQAHRASGSSAWRRSITTSSSRAGRSPRSSCASGSSSILFALLSLSTLKLR